MLNVGISDRFLKLIVASIIVIQVKYLWLLFDLAAGGDNLVEKGPHP